MNPAAALRDRVLDAWLAGAKATTIANQEKITLGAVINIARVARANGDPRAVNRFEAKVASTHLAHEYWSRKQLEKFDYAFKRRMLAAIAAGKEVCRMQGDA